MSERTETDIPWVGDIPSDWRMFPLFSVAHENKKKNKEKNENVLSLSYGRIIRRDLSKNFGLIPENFDGYQVVDDGYIIIRSTDLQNDKKSLRVGLVHEYGVITSAYIGLTPLENIYSDYLFYYLNMCDLKKVFYSLGGGLRQSLRFEEFRRFPIVVPPLKEQKIIALYLDKKTDQIDSLIKNIQKRIELLKEQRTSLINQFVTKGLDPNVEMKDSGVEWIGDIPQHWKVSKIGRHFRLERGRIISNIEISESLGPYPVYSSQTKNNGEMGSINSFDFEGEYVSWTTDGANAGTCFYREGKFNVTNVCGLLSSQELETNYRFLSFFLNLGTRNYVRLDINPKLMNDMMSEIPFLVVPLEEQNKIVSIIRKTTDNSEKIILAEERRTDILKEYRQSLISSVVTGKVRVTEEMI